MIDKLPKKECTGCGCCVDCCPQQAIALAIDDEGFWHPFIHADLCDHCELCERQCPILNMDELSFSDATLSDCYGGYHKDIEIRFDSSSGGVFSALAESVLKDGGYVCGAVYDDEFDVRHVATNNPEDLRVLRSSKYQQSDAVGIYRQIGELLGRGETVLFCGTPCQCAAVKSFLNRDYEYLLLVDFVCRGVASPLFHKKYLDYIQEQNKERLIRCKSNNKELGWRQLTQRFDFSKGKSIYIKGQDDPFISMYQRNMISRPCCYDCRFTGSQRVSDITIGNFWGVEKSHPELDDDMGTSAIIVNTVKGRKFWEIASHRCVFKKIEWKDIIIYNPYLSGHRISIPKTRNVFFKKMVTDNYSIIECLHQSKCINSLLYTFLRIVHRVIYCSRLRPKPLWQFIYYNFFSGNIQWNFRRMGFLFPTPYCTIELDKTAKIVLNGAFVLGRKAVRSSQLETRLWMWKGTRLIVRDEFHLGFGSHLEITRDGDLDWGSGGSSHGVVIVCGDHMRVGDHVSLGHGVTIRDSNDHILALTGFKMTKPVHIGNHVWICSNAVVMPGVKIGDGGVVGAMSFVCRNVKHHTLVSGNPAKYVQEVEYFKM